MNNAIQSMGVEFRTMPVETPPGGGSHGQGSGAFTEKLGEFLSDQAQADGAVIGGELGAGDGNNFWTPDMLASAGGALPSMKAQAQADYIPLGPILPDPDA